ncbi:MAG: SMC family ATPase [Chloroflexota bacterium]|nr:SMC family ATPase [Chloroflexota bacterium]
MIPLSLTVENFMCYGEGVPTLNLEPIHIACISGNNGYGKTALLDAITWAIWGKSRAKTHDELVNLNQQSMFVELDFVVHDLRYKVTRTYSKSKGSSAGKSELNLSLVDKDRVTSLMANTIRETEEKIISLLNMDYETFINTSYLKQGDSNRFTSSRPTERKKILADILDLSYYETLESASKQMSRELGTDVAIKKALIDNSIPVVEEKEDAIKNLATYKEESEKLSLEELTLNTHLESLKIKQQIISTEISNSNVIAKQIETSEKEIETLQSQKLRLETELTELRNLLTRAAEIKSKYELYKTLQYKHGHSMELMSEIHRIKEAKTLIENEIAMERIKLESQISSIHKQIKTDLQPLIDNIPKIKQEIIISDTTVKNLEAILKENDLLLNRASAISQEIALLETSNKALMTQMSDTRNRFDLINQSEATCPLCLQSISSDNKNHISMELEKEGKTSRTKYQSNLAQIQALDKERLDLAIKPESVVSNLIEEKAGAEKLLTKLMGTLSQCENASDQIKPIQKDVNRLEQQLKSENFCSDQQQNLLGLQSRLNELNAAELDHKSIEANLKKLEPYAKSYSQLSDSEDRLKSTTQLLDDNKTIITARNKQTCDWKTELLAIKEKISKESGIDDEICSIQSRLKEIRIKNSKVTSLREKARYQIEEILKSEENIKSTELAISKANEEIQLYDELSSAFGRNGIQALMIERAVPMLEDVANELLARLSDNKMVVNLELKEGRIDRATGLPSEALDITISDEQGSRSYETFSGGETFRIDFAIRIAMSKLLATRSGAPLPILFIDEGFGSQDNIGQERLIEVIQSISDDFQKIIVITHVDSMKENFSQQIEISRTETGSIFTLR